MAEPPKKRLKIDILTTKKAYTGKAKSSSGKKTEIISDNLFFAGIKALFVENGLGKTRVSILSEKLNKHGGERQTKLQNTTTHIFVAQNIKFERIPKLLGLKAKSVPGGCKVVLADWISKCLADGKRTSLEAYLVNSPAEKAMAKEGTSEDPAIDSSEKCIPVVRKEETLPSTSFQKSETKHFPGNKIAEDNDSESDFVESGDEDSGMKEGSVSGKPRVATNIIDLSTSADEIKEKWICAGTSTSRGDNHNQEITDQLQILATSYANTKDQWRALGYKKAISSIKSYHKKIETQEECISLPFVGERLAKKIWEIVQTGHLRRLDHIDPKMDAINLFSNVWGAGPKTAEIWISKGLRSLEDLQKYGDLTKQQEIGLKYYKEFIERMPREEAGRIGDEVKKSALTINPGLLCVTCGSYRRGKSTCGDVDVLVSHPDGKSHHGVMGPLIQELKLTGFLTDDLVSPDKQDQRKYMGVCKLPGERTKHRRLDIIVVPHNELGCAIVYFTGSDHFNRSVRLLAKKNGMSLSEHALKTGVIRKGGEKIYEGTAIPVNSEKDLFDILGLEYREPHERDW